MYTIRKTVQEDIHGKKNIQAADKRYRSGLLLCHVHQRNNVHNKAPLQSQERIFNHQIQECS